MKIEKKICSKSGKLATSIVKKRNGVDMLVKMVQLFDYHIHERMEVDPQNNMLIPQQIKLIL